MATETSLARQLKNLAVPQTDLLLQDKIRKSFLFDHREAATLDRDTIFAYGTTGLEKLCIINPAFEKFEKSLFNINSLGLERSVQDSKVNEKLDVKIEEFLTLLSPYFLNRAAHEALEWLVYRFHVHRYNVDALVGSAIPHFNTSVFVRVVQLLDFRNETGRWVWLKPVQQSGVHLEYSAILNHFNRDLAFRKFICELAPKIVKVYDGQPTVVTSVIAFSMLTISDALKRSDNISHSMVAFLFPYVLKGLKSNIIQYTASSYVIIANLLNQVQLTEEVVTEMLAKIFKCVKNELSSEAFEILLLAYQKQPIKKLDMKFFKNMWIMDDSSMRLAHMAESYESTSLLSAIISKTISVLFHYLTSFPSNRKTKALRKFCQNFLDCIKLNAKTVSSCFNAILRNFSKFCEKKSAERRILYKASKVMLKNLETQYPEQFECAVGKYFKKGKIKNRTQLTKLVNNAICDLKNAVLSDTSTPIFLGINHFDTNIRILSIQFLLRKVDAETISDVDFISTSLLERLRDDEPLVVEVILQNPDILLKFVSKKNVLEAFDYILKRGASKRGVWSTVQAMCFDIVCNYFNSNDNLSFEIFSTIMPFVFPLTKSNFKGFLAIVSSELKESIPIINAINDDVISELTVKVKKDDIERLNCNVVYAVQKYLTGLNNADKRAFILILGSKCEVTKDNVLSVMYIFTLKFMINSEIDLKQKFDLLEALFSFLHSTNFSAILWTKLPDNISEESVMQSIVVALREKKLCCLMIYWTLLELIKSLVINLSTHDCQNWQNSNIDINNKVKILTLIFHFCVKKVNSSNVIQSQYFRKLISEFLRAQFKSEQELFWFLSNVSMTSELTIEALHIANVMCDEEKTFNWLFENYVICNGLFLAIASPARGIRSIALKLFKNIQQNSQQCRSPLKFLVDEILSNAEEINVDHLQFYNIVCQWLSPAYDTSVRSKSKALKQNLILENFIKLLLDNSTPLCIKLNIVTCLTHIDSVDALSALVPVLEQCLMQCEKAKQVDSVLLQIMDHLLHKFTVKTAIAMKEDSKEAVVFLKCLQFQFQESTSGDCLQILAVKILTKEFFNGIPAQAIQKKILDSLLTKYIVSQLGVHAEVKKALNKLSMYAFLILNESEDISTSSPKKTSLREMKKLRTDVRQMSEDFETDTWKKIIILLEMVQNKSTLDKKEQLVSHLFTLLNKTVNQDNQTKAEYVRQLILSSIYNCCQQLGSADLDERQFQVELIIQCIRSSTSPRTHQQALLLLNLAATMFPDYVLTNVMSIFTFMGSSLVRQDNSYSFQVISQTIETIVPSLLEANSHKSESESLQTVGAVIRVFIDSLEDIPRHRQLPLFTKLITTLEASSYLWIPLAQICDQYATIFQDIGPEDIVNWKIPPTLEFAVNLQKYFSPKVQIDSCITMLDFLSYLPESKTDDPAVEYTKEPFNVATHTNQQLQAYKHNVLCYVNLWLSSPAFVSQVSELSVKGQSRLEDRYEMLFEKTLNYLQQQRSLKDSESKKDLLPLLFNLIGHINNLLPSTLFIRVVKRLLLHTEPVIQKKAIELLTSKLEQQFDLFDENSHKLLLKLLKPLLKIINDESLKSIINQQSALFALHLLTKIIGSVYPSKFHKVLKVTIQILKHGECNELTGNALLCLAQLCSSLNIDILPHLNTFMPIITDCLSKYRLLEADDCMILGIITALHSLIVTLGMFLSSYMPKLVSGICLLSTKYQQASRGVVGEKLLDLQNLLANDVALRVLLPALEHSYSSIFSEDKNAIGPLVHILNEKLSSCSYEDVEACSTELQKFYIVLIDFRNTQSSEMSIDDVSSIELQIITAFKSFVMKLSVTHFRTFFQKLFHWATATEEGQESKLRVHTFYRLTFELSVSLKNLFVPMARYFLRHASSTLDLNNSSKNEDIKLPFNSAMSSELLDHIFDTLKTCFIYDDGKLLDKDYFDVLMQPLVDQLENLTATDSVYQHRIANHLSGCIAHFMAAVSDNGQWKKLNYQILLKTRHECTMVRFAAVQVIREIVRVMGDSYLVLLPESIPFLAEVMEDESAEVEEECKAAIVEMEKILGEPIRKYF